MSTYEPAETLDVRGLSCPMPVVKTRDTADELESDEILQAIAADPGSMSDLKGWVDAIDGIATLDQEEIKKDGDAIFRHFI